MRSKFGTVTCCFHGLHPMRTAAMLAGITVQRVEMVTGSPPSVDVSKQRGRESFETGSVLSRRRVAPFPSRRNKALCPPPSSSQRASVAAIAGLLPAFSDVFAVFRSKGSAVRTCRFFFFFSHSYLIKRSVGCTEREGGGGGGGQPSSTSPPTRFHLKKCNATSVPKTRC